MSAPYKYNELEEDDIRKWFMHVELEQARDTMNVVRGIVDGRVMAQPKRKRRSDAGEKREGGGIYGAGVRGGLLDENPPPVEGKLSK